jgi:MarR family transcriptional regulator for hemolysin
MYPYHPHRELAFLINDVARLLKTGIDQEARRYGMTRAQWAVLARLERHEGLKQAELADMLDLQPITLTRLVDRLCDNGLIERRADPDDRRAKRLYLTKAAKPVMEQLYGVGRALMAATLKGIEPDRIEQMIATLGHAKENLREILQDNADERSARYG